MTPQSLKRPFVGITMTAQDHIKVKGVMPTPSYISPLHSHNTQRTILIYAIDGYITSSTQYRWLSNIKLGLREYLFVEFEFVEEYYINEHTHITSAIYTLKELSKAFQAPLITYPKIMYPSTKKELYRALCWHGTRLIHQGYFTPEAMTAAALQMNNKLSDKYQHKEVLKKALGAYVFINDHKDDLPKRLNKSELKKAHSKGAQTKNKLQRQKTQKAIMLLLRDDNFIKPNGKPNLSSLAKALNMTRQTIAKHIKALENTAIIQQRNTHPTQSTQNTVN